MLGRPDDPNKPHTCDSERCPEGGNYYVSAIDGPEWFIMAGPYSTHAAALADVQKALNIAYEREAKAWFMSWGTVRMPDDYSKPGVLNRHSLI